MKRLIPYIIAIIFLALFLNQCQKTKQMQKQYDNTADYLRDSIIYYKNGQGAEIASRIALQGDKDQLKTLLNNTIDENGQLKGLVSKYKKAIAAGNITIVTKIDTIKIGYEVPIPFEFSRDWSKTDQWYNIGGNSDQNGITINSIEIPNRLSFAIGDKKTEWFKTEYRIEAVSSNPFVKIEGLDSYTLQVPQKRFNIGLTAGYGISKDGLSPFVGIGVGYSLIRF